MDCGINSECLKFCVNTSCKYNDNELNLNSIFVHLKRFFTADYLWDVYILSFS